MNKSFKHIKKFNESDEVEDKTDGSNAKSLDERSAVEQLKGLYDMTIDGYDYHFMSATKDSKEDLQAKIDWFSSWMKKVRKNMDRLS